MKHIERDFLEKEIDTLNEISSENVIYDESQDGPQEEPYLKEFHLNLEKWRLYRKNQKNNHK